MRILSAGFWTWGVTLMGAALSAPLSRAQEVRIPEAVTTANPSSGGNLANFFTSRTPYEFWLTCLIGIVGLSIIGALLLAFRNVRNVKPEDITRPLIVITVIIGTLILVTAGYSNEQIAPAFGLFGTIVGYILGRLSQSQSPHEGSSENRSAAVQNGAVNRSP